VNIQPIVEGHGEVTAVPVLLRRLRDEAQCFSLDVNSPIRRKRSQLVQETQLRNSIRLARLQPQCGGIIVLLDSDDDCPKELMPTLQAIAQSEAGPIPCLVVLAHREYEAWFLASIESLRRKRGVRADAESHPRPEEPRDAKGQLEMRMEKGKSYHETSDQAALSAEFDMKPAYRQCRSFRRMVKAYIEIAVALGANLPGPWPPADWNPQPEEH
jgi:hypothetical protein